MKSKFRFRQLVVHDDTYNKLKSLGHVTESFDFVINRLIETEIHMQRVRELEEKVVMGETLAGQHPITTCTQKSKEVETTLG